MRFLKVVPEGTVRLLRVGPEADVLPLGRGFGRPRLSLLLLRALDLVAGQKFERQLPVGLRPAGARIVHSDRLAMAGSLGEPDVARNIRLEQFFTEEAAQIL